MTRINITGTSSDEAWLDLSVTLRRDGKAAFDLSVRSGGKYKVVCADINRADAEAIIAGLRDVFPESVPDIHIPESPDAPSVVNVELDGERLTLVNWLDFRGWEVRRRPSHTRESDLLLGWLRNVNDVGPVTATSQRLRYGLFEQQFARKDEALRWLLKVVNQ